MGGSYVQVGFLIHIFTVALLIYWIVMAFRNEKIVSFTFSCVAGIVYAILIGAFFTSNFYVAVYIILPLSIPMAVIIWFGSAVEYHRKGRKKI